MVKDTYTHMHCKCKINNNVSVLLSFFIPFLCTFSFGLKMSGGAGEGVHKWQRAKSGKTSNIFPSMHLHHQNFTEKSSIEITAVSKNVQLKFNS